MTDYKKPVAAKIAATARAENSSTDMRIEIDKLHRLVTYGRECLENSLYKETLGYKKEHLDKNQAASIQALATSMEKLVNIKMKYDKHLKDEADKLTPEEELDALEEFFAGQDVPERRAFILRLVNRHNALIKGTAFQTVTVNIGSR